MAKSYDLVIRGGTVVDGTGAPARKADVALRGPAIADVGDLDPAVEAPVLDVTGLVVAPGFIDAWAAADPLAPVFPDAASKLLQGVTTEVAGAGPRYPFPLAEGATESFDGLGPGFPAPDWTDAKGFMVSVSRATSGINRAFVASYAQIRRCVIGPSDSRPTRDEARRISLELDSALAAGCLGLEVDLAEPPGAFASAEQIVEVGRQLVEAGAVMALSLRDTGGGLESAVEEALEVASRTGVEMVIPSLRINPAPYWQKIDWLAARLARAREAGSDLIVTVEPYVAWLGQLASLLPPLAREGGPEVAAKRLAGSAAREEVIVALRSRAEGDEGYWTRFSPALPGGAGPDLTQRHDSLADIAAARNRPPAEVLIDLLAERPGAPVLFFEISEGNVEKMLGWEFATVGSSSPARPLDDPRVQPSVHPRDLGTFARVLRRYLRDKRVFSLEEAVRRMTSFPADFYGLTGRGRIEPDSAADLVIFDAEKVADRSTFGNPSSRPEGIEHVIVAGRLAVRDGQVTGVRAGQVLRRALAGGRPAS